MIPFLMFASLIGLIAIGFPVAFSMFTVAGAFGLVLFGDAISFQLMSKVGDVTSNAVLAAVPLFVFMGAILEKSGIADRLFGVLQQWSHRLPGGLAVSTVALGTVFAAASGVVGATETVVGMLAVPAMLKAGYDKRLISGTVCAAGSLGTVIPPSVTVIVMGPVANVSVGQLFAGLLFPGLMMAAAFLLYVIGVAVLRPGMAPRSSRPEEPLAYARLIRETLTSIVPPVVLIFFVLGTIFIGLATPTEAAACGAAAAVVMAVAYRRLSAGLLIEALWRTASITAMILMIVLAGSMFAGVFFASGGMATIQGLVSGSGLPPMGVFALVLLLAFVAGFVLDLISVVLILIPISMPVISGLGIDPIWFCVAFLIVLQTSYLTPPMAPAIFYLRAVAPPEVTLLHMYKGVVPFIVLQWVVLGLVLAFPGLALWLPEQLAGARW